MARNLPAKKAKYTQPVTKKLRFILNHTHTGTGKNNDSHFIDLAQALSIANRKAYRQGLVYAVKGVSVFDSNADVSVKIGTIGENWVSRSAWVRAFRHWMKMNRQVPNASSIQGAWADFKVYMSKKHMDQSASDLPLPVLLGDSTGQWDSGGSVVNEQFNIPTGEWVYSKFTSQDPDLESSGGNVVLDSLTPDEFHMHMLGSHTLETDTDKFISVGAIQSYSDSRVTVTTTPAISGLVVNDPLANLFDSGDVNDDILNDLQDDNDQPPYSITQYIGEGLATQGGQPQMQARICTSPTNRLSYSGGFLAICGLLEVVTNCAADNKIELVIELEAGNYNGVAAANMM